MALFVLLVVPLTLLGYWVLRRPALMIVGNSVIVVRGLLATRRMSIAEFDRLSPGPRELGTARLVSVSGDAIPVRFAPSTLSEDRERIRRLLIEAKEAAHS